MGVRFLWLALLCPTLALAAEATGAARLSASVGADTNPGRDFGDVPRPDAVASAMGTAEGALRSGALALNGSYALGGRTFASQQEADLWVQAADLDLAVTATPWLRVGLAGRAKDRHAGSRGRAYADLSAGPFVALVPSPALALELHAEARRFLYRDAEAFSFGAGELRLLGRYRLSPRHAFSLSLLSARERYAAEAVDAHAQTLGTRRRDTRLGGALGYRYRGPFALSLEYGLEGVSSNSFGEAQLRHRVTATLGLRLPARLMLFLEGALQLTRYPDGVYLSPEILLLEDDENLNSAAVRLVRPLSPHVDLELSYGVYQTRLSQTGLSYLRQLATAGATLRF